MIQKTYTESQRAAAISIVEYCITRGINGYEDRMYDAWQISGTILHHLYPEEYNEGEFRKVIYAVEKEGVNVHISRKSMNEHASTIFKHTENPSFVATSNR